MAAPIFNCQRNAERANCERDVSHLITMLTLSDLLSRKAVPHTFANSDPTVIEVLNQQSSWRTLLIATTVLCSCISYIFYTLLLLIELCILPISFPSSALPFPCSSGSQFTQDISPFPVSFSDTMIKQYQLEEERVFSSLQFHCPSLMGIRERSQASNLEARAKQHP